MKYILIGLMLSLILFGCKKEDPTCNQVREAPKEFLDYFYFNKGSWWVYQLRGTLQYDTVRVTAIEKRFHDLDTRGLEQCVNFYSIYLTHSNQYYFQGKDFHKSAEYLSARPLSGTDNWYIQWSIFSVNNTSPGILFHYPYVFNEPLFQGEGMIIDEGPIYTPIQRFDSTVTVLSGRYNQTDSLIYNSIKRIYLTPKVGVIRVDYLNNMTWELVNYKLQP